MKYPNLRIISQSILLLFCLLVSNAIAQEVPQAAPRIATGTWAEALKEHPRLLGSRAHLRALAKAKPELYNQVVKGLSGQWLQADGIIHAVDGLPAEKIQPYIQRALKHVQRGATNVHQDTWIWMEEVVFTYDFFYDAIAPADRRKMIDWLNANRVSFTTDENAFHNSTLSKILTYVRIAYATWGENPEAKEFRDHALIKLYEGKVLPVLQEVGAGGGFTEAGWYARGSLWHLTQALELARRFENYDGFAKAPRFFYQRLAYEMFQPYPGRWEYGAERFPVEGDGSHVYGGHTEYPRLMRTVLAQYFRGSELSRAVSNKQRRGSNSHSRVEDFLYEETPDAPLDLKTFPLAHHAAGIGKVYARSDWTDNATWFRFDCGDYWVGHQHFEVGNFEIFQHEPLATESGEYHDWASDHAMNWLIRTVAHNSILVHQPDEKWTMMRDGGRLKYANDGGQAKKWEWTVDTLEQWKQKREQFERGDIVAYQNTPAYLYVAGDCTAAYAPSKLSSWVRQIVYLRPGTFVIFDRVISTKPEFEKTWLLHCHNEPSMQNQTASITNGKGQLMVQTLLPEKAQIRKVQGYTYGGQTFDPPQSALSATAAKWRIEVLPSAPQKEDVFLHVLSTGEAAPAQLIRKGNGIGARIGGTEVLFDGKVGGALKVANNEFALKPTVQTGKYE
jgi:hypothetical protein